MSLSPSEEVTRDVTTGDVVIIVPSSNNNNCVQTVVAIDSDSEHAANDSSGIVSKLREKNLCGKGSIGPSYDLSGEKIRMGTFPSVLRVCPKAKGLRCRNHKWKNASPK